MKITNELDLPYGFVKAVSTAPHNVEGSLSATTLLKGIKETILTIRHWDELSIDAADKVWQVFGTAVHALLEREGEDEVTEETMSQEIGGVTITGRMDCYNLRTGVITDYKTASVWKLMAGDSYDWYRQGMIYAWLLTKSGFEVDRCRFVALLKDHSKAKARHDRNYPKAPVWVYQFSVFRERLEDIERYITAKVEQYLQYKDAEDDFIPPCSPEERWAKPTTWAVRKQGVKRAHRVMEAEEAAQKLAADLGKGYFVEERRGEQTKCEGYCTCREFCSFYRALVAAETAEEATA
jgi:hypothetical protein